MTPFDCELVRDGWAAQPINTLSAAAFVVVGLWLWRTGRRVAALLAAAVGIGSVWFHGSPGSAATWVHDVALYALALAAAIEATRLTVGHRPPALASAIFTSGLVVWFFSRTGGPLCDPDSVIQGHAVWHVAAAAAFAVLFRTDRSTLTP